MIKLLLLVTSSCALHVRDHVPDPEVMAAGPQVIFAPDPETIAMHERFQLALHAANLPAVPTGPLVIQVHDPAIHVASEPAVTCAGRP